MKPLKTLTKDAQVGIYDCQFVARIYRTMIVVICPYVKWVGNTGSYSEYKHTIRDKNVVSRIIKSLADDEDLAWNYIRRAIDDLSY